MQEKVDAEFLVELWDEERSQEHERPARKIEKGYYKLVFVVMGEICIIHNEVDVEIIIYFVI